jgi:DNA-binding NarL/FixJ family response regulator
MNIVLLTPIHLLADGLKAALSSREDISTIAVAKTFSALRETLTTAQIDLALIDVTQEVDCDELGKFAADFPQLALWALGPEQQLHDLKREENSTFSGYISRSASIEELYQAISGSASSPDTRSKSLGFPFARFFRQ